LAKVIDIVEFENVSTFTEHVGSVFRIEMGPAQFAEAELIEAEALAANGRPSDSNQREPFSLLFDVQGDIDLPQQIYNISHDQLGDLPLFLVPVGSGRMESVFN
jgi:hypothetical protein